jgi:hypothetical protein
MAGFANDWASNRALKLPSAVLWITNTGLDEIGLSRDPQALPRIRKHSRVNGHYGVYQD